jgi:soluble lytic murein transglycosylase-like protein
MTSAATPARALAARLAAAALAGFVAEARAEPQSLPPPLRPLIQPAPAPPRAHRTPPPLRPPAPAEWARSRIAGAAWLGGVGASLTPRPGAPRSPLLAATPSKPLLAATPSKPLLAAGPSKPLLAAGPSKPLLAAGPSKPLLAVRPGADAGSRPAAWARPAPSLAPARGGKAGDVAPGPCEAQVTRAARRHGVPEGVLYAVGLVETGRKNGLSPYALNIEGEPVFAQTPAEALRRFEAARAAGKRLIDLGCMQINHHFHGAAFASPAAMLDPAANVDYAARFLTQLRAREGSWTMAVARYHAGPNNNPAQKRYVCAVIGALARTGAGAWTDSSRAFCS